MDKPFVVCHMLASLDGKIDGDFMVAPENAPVLQEYGKLRVSYACQATLYGTVTMEGSYSETRMSELPNSRMLYPKEDYQAPTDVKNYIVSIDPKGILGWKSKYIERKNRPKSHVIEVLTEQVSNNYLAYLRQFDISYIFAGQDQLDCNVVLYKLKTVFQIDRLMIAGGGLMNWSFLQDNLIDELSLVISPLADGNRKAVSIFEKAEFLPDRTPAVFTLKEVKQIEGDGLWLRYLLKR